ncbi:MAG: hypothetical protein HRU70_08635 [Phycisphaeraceae bacterium]|nr:MAG: hypothetical protein HRU70_08635 [Phycisphaeraceae bacterium]
MRMIDLSLATMITIGITTSVFACFVIVKKPCCSMLEGPRLPQSGGNCPDSLIENPDIDSADGASPYELGKTQRSSSGTSAKSVWEDFVINGNGNCIYLETVISYCTPQVLGGYDCSGIPPQ